MASLFNTKISDTYPGLIKTLDNAAISASLKELTDGSGNQSGLFINNTGDFKASGILEFGSLKDTGENITITKFVDEADGIANNDNDTTIPTSAAVVDYVASKITLEDLDFSGDSGTGSVDLDSQVFAITGTTNQIITSASSQTLNLSLPSTIHRNLQGNVTGNITGVGTLSDGSTAVTQSDGDNSTKIATTAYVDTAIQGHDTLAEVLAGGNTTGGTDISVSTGDNINFADSTKANFGNSNDLEIYHNSTDNFYSGTTGDMYFINKADDKDIIFQSDNGSGGYDTYFKLWGAISSLAVYKDMLFVNDGNGGKLKFGASQDLQIYHEGSNSFIDDSGTGDLYVRASDNMYFQTYGSGKKWITLTENAGAELFYNDSKKLETTNTGITVAGNIDGVGNLFLQDYIYHSGDGDTYFGFPTANEFKLVTGGSNIIAADANSAYLYYQGNVKLQTTASGVTITGDLLIYLDNGGYFEVDKSDNSVKYADNTKAKFGTGQDLEIYHDGSNSYISDIGTGSLFITGANNIYLQNGSNETYLDTTTNGAVRLFHDNSLKLYTTSTGVSVTGNIVATNSGVADIKSVSTGGYAGVTIEADDSSNSFVFFRDTSGERARIFSSPNNDLKFNVNGGGTTALELGAGTNATFSGSVTIAGDLTVNGTTTTVNTEHFNVEDPLISMAKDNAANSVDIGFYGRYNDGTNRYLGLFADASDSNTFKLFKGVTTEPTTTVDITATGYTLADLDIGSLTSTGTISYGNSIGILTYGSDRAILRSASGKVLELQTNGGSAALTLDNTQNAQFSNAVLLADNKKLEFGGAGDLKIYHIAGGDSYIETTTENLVIQNTADDADIIFESDNGSGGTTEYFRLDGGSTLNVFSKATWYGDGVKAMFGNSTDLQIFHDGSNSYIEDTGTGVLYIRSGDSLRLQGINQSNFLIANQGGNVNLYYNNVGKFETTNTGVKINSTGAGAIATIEAGDGNQASLDLKNTEGHYRIITDAGEYKIYDQTDSRTPFVIDTSGNSTFAGNVATSLQLRSIGADTQTGATVSANLGIKLQNTSDTNGNFQTIDFFNSTGFVTGRIAAQFQDAGDRNTDLYFCTRANSGSLTERLRIDSNGASTFAGLITCNNVGNDKKIAFRRTGANNFSIEHDSAFLYFYNETTSNVIFKMANNNDVTFTGNVSLVDDKKILIGTGDDLEIYHNGTTGNSNIDNINGNLYISNLSDNNDIFFRGTDGGSTITALTLDMSNGGSATFRDDIDFGGKITQTGTGTNTFAGNINSNSHIRSAQGSGGVSLSGYASPDFGFLGYNYVNDNGTESVSQSVRNSWRVKFGNGSDRNISFDYRAPNAAADAFTKRVGITSDGELTIGSSTGATALLQIEDTAKTRKMTLQSNGNNQGFARNMTVVNHYPVVSSGSQLIIPFQQQGNLNSTTIIKLMGHSARFNSSNPLGFTATIQTGHLQGLYSTALLDSTGNISGISVSGMNLIVSFTTAYTNVTADGVFVTLEYMTNNISYSIDVANIAMN